MARVLFVIPFKDSKNFMVHQPLGAMYLATALREKRGDEVRILDMRLYGNDPEIFERTLKEFEPDVVGASAMAYETDEAVKLLGRVKSVTPTAVRIIGGPCVSTFEKRLAENENVDFTCYGEGEDLLPALVTAIESNNSEPDIPGLGYAAGGQVVTIERAILAEELDSYGFPAWDLIEVEKYFDLPRQGQFYAHKEYMSIFTSRGCPFRCAYCHNVFGKKFRARSPEHVLAELTALKNKYGIREISVLDDSFNIDKKRLYLISEKIAVAGLDLKFNFSNGIRADMADDDVLYALKKMGAYKVAVAVESASYRLQKMIHKNAKLDKLDVFVKKAEKAGIITWGFFMLGFPTETENEARSTVRFALKSRLHLASFNIVNPYPGTELFDLAGFSGREEELVTSSFDFLSPDIQVSEVPVAKLKRIRWTGNLIFYLNPLRVVRFFALLPNKRQIFGALWSFIRRLTVWA